MCGKVSHLAEIKILFCFVITYKSYSGQAGWKLVGNTKNIFFVNKYGWIIRFSVWGINGGIWQWRRNCQQYFVWRRQKDCGRCHFLKHKISITKNKTIL